MATENFGVFLVQEHQALFQGDSTGNQQFGTWGRVHTGGGMKKREEFNAQGEKTNKATILQLESCLSLR